MHGLGDLYGHGLILILSPRAWSTSHVTNFLASRRTFLLCLGSRHSLDCGQAAAFWAVPRASVESHLCIASDIYYNGEVVADRRTSMAASKLYEKFPLDSERTQIRIIELAWTWTSLTPIVCRFSVHNIDHCPTYKALSYTWGEEEADREIIVDGIPIDIRDNLWQFLQKARRHVLCLRLWIDAICIDQSNVAERSHQVSLMKHIYSNVS